MSEKVLSSLMHFFAMLFKTDANIDIDIAKNIIVSFLQKQFDKTTTNAYTEKFVEIFNETNSEISSETELSEEAASFSAGLFLSLPFKQRIFLIVNLLSFSRLLSSIVTNQNTISAILKKIDDIARIFKLSEERYNNIKLFAFGKYEEILDQDNFLIITSLDIGRASSVNKLIVKGLKGQFLVLRFKYDFCLLAYQGADEIYLDDKLIIQDNLYIISNSSSIVSKSFETIYFTDILKKYLSSNTSSNISYVAKNIEYSFSRKKKGLHPFNIECRQNEMVCVIGSSGVGKSTLLKLLCGILPIESGELCINGTNIIDKNYSISNYVGYIPQEEILFENLTVYENIYYHAKLCIKSKSEEALRQEILEIIETLGLYDIKDYKVGTLSHKIISGGQRKRLNIALELIRDPDILFIDEPTSGLSSSDAEKIISLLKQLTLKGKIIFVNIHQPSDQVFHLFDKLIIMDKGGYPIYIGHPGEACKYLSEKAHTIETTKANENISESERILEIVENTTINEFGNSTNVRKILPVEWYKHYVKSASVKESKQPVNDKSAEINEKVKKTTKKPTRITQFYIYLLRNIKTKFANKSYMLISFIVAPALALVLSLFCKQMVLDDSETYTYIFGKNENIPSFIFMSIIVALFVGLMTSAEEVIKDKSTLAKETFLNLSSVSYLASKLLFLFVLSVIQAVSYTLISYVVLQFNNGFFVFFLSLALISFLANVIGLIISTLFNTTVAVYILIPFIIIPQILLSGIVIKFDNIHPLLASAKYTPAISDLMPTRWSYELIMVDQFKNNKYQQKLHPIESEINKINYKILALIPELKERNEALLLAKKQNTSLSKQNIGVINTELKNLNISNVVLTEKSENSTIHSINSALNDYKKTLAQKRDSLFYVKDVVYKNLIEEKGGREELTVFKNENYNENIANLVTEKESFRQYIIWKDEIIQKSTPIYKEPKSKIGRAHFFSSNKMIASTVIDTVSFNFVVMVVYVIAFITLLFFLFRYKYKFKY